MARGIQIEAIKLWLNNYFNFIRKKFLIAVIVGLLGLGIGLYYAINYKPYFVSQLSFIINDGKSSSIGALSAIAGQLGIGGTGPSITDDRIMFLLSSKKILGSVLLKKIEGTNETIGEGMISAFKLSSAIKSDSIMNDFGGFKSQEIEKINKQESYALDIIINFIKISNRFKVESVKRKANSLYGNQSNGIISLSFECRNEILAKEFINAIYFELTKFYSESMLRNLQNNYDLLSFRADSIGKLLYLTENESAIASDNSYNVFRFQGKVDEFRLRKEVEMLNVLYIEVLKNKEIAKFTLDQERPLFQLVDEPILPLEKKVKSIPVFGFLGFFMFTLFGLFLLTLMFLSKKENRSFKDFI